MISVTKAYKDATKKPLRQSYVTIKYGLYNKEAKQELSSVVSNGEQPFSSVNNTLNETKDNVYNYITCEPNRVKLDSNYVFIGDKSRVNSSQDTGYWSSIISDENGLFEKMPYITYELNTPISFTPLTLYFQEVVKDINIKYYLNNNILYTREIRNNKLLTVDTTNEDSNLPTYFDKVEIDFISTETPYRYIKFNEIDFGAYRVFKSNEIKTFNIIEEIDLRSDSLPSNSLNATIEDNTGKYDILNPNNSIQFLQQGQELSVHHHLKVGNVFREVLLGTFRLKKVSSENMKLKLECYDELYFMNSTFYGSKVYFNEKATTIFKDLFDYFGYVDTRYTIDSKLDDVYLTGYIPQVSFREALRLIAESCKAVIKKRRTGGIYIFKDDRETRPIVNLFKTTEYNNSQVKENLYNNTIDVKFYNYDRRGEDTLYSSTLNKGTYNISFSKIPLVYQDYVDDPNLLKKEETNKFNIISVNANGCKIEVYEDETKVELYGNYYIETATNERVKLNEDIETDESAIEKIDNHLLTIDNYKDICYWKLNRSNVSYELKYKTTPYIEVGDKCQIQTKYKDSSNNMLVRNLTINKIEYDQTIMQEIKGE